MASPSQLTLGWIGLGSMGVGMASNIQKFLAAQKHAPLRVYNRTASRCGPVESLGAKRCNSIADLAQECNVIFLSSSDDGAVVSITDQIIAAGSITGKAIVDTTTIHPSTTKQVGEKLTAAGGQFAALPVFGASPAAAAGTLLCAFSGPDAVLETISPFLKGVIAREVMVVSKEDPSKSTLLKATRHAVQSSSVNLMMASLMQIVGEAHVLAEKSGLDAAVLERLLELLMGPVAHSDSIRMTTGVYCPAPGDSPWSGLELGIKDVGIAVELAEKEGVSLKAGKTALERMKQAKEWSTKEADEGKERNLDSSSIFGTIRQESGLDFETEFVKSRDRESS